MIRTLEHCSCGCRAAGVFNAFVRFTPLLRRCKCGTSSIVDGFKDLYSDLASIHAAAVVAVFSSRNRLDQTTRLASSPPLREM